MHSIFPLALGALAVTHLLPAAQAQCTQVQWHASDASIIDQFGSALAAEADRVLVGAPEASGVVFGNSGAVYVFERQAGGFVQTHRLVSADGGNGDEFGAAVALDGARAAVGAFRFGDPQGPGAVYVFDETPAGWVQSAKLQPAFASAAIGGAVDLDGDRLVAGSGFASRAWVFEFDGTDWIETVEFTDVFASSVAIEGDTLVLGAFEDVASPDFSGSCHVYERQAGGAWVRVQTLFASPPTSPLMHFGTSVALDGERLAVGAPERAGASTGAVFVFERQAGTWVETAVIEIADLPDPAHFGRTVALAGDRLLVGSPDAAGPGGASGAALLFELAGGAWQQIARLDAFEGAPAERLGAAVAFAGGTLLAGSPRDGDQGFATGAVYAFELAPEVSSFCHCAAGAPCGNEDPWGGCAGAAGDGAVLAAFGSASAAADDLVFTATMLPPGQAGLVFMGASSGAPFLFGDGLRCVAPGPLFRFPIELADEHGCLQLGPGVVAHTHAEFNPNGRIHPGATWNFQGWHRDPSGPCGSGFNTSNAVRVTFQL